jgi:polyhydroxyalkanoate synthase subunit PhaC
MTSTHTPTHSSWHPVLDDFADLAENLTLGADSADLLRELLIASGMTLKNPAGIIAANARLVWGSAGAFRAAVDRAMGRDNAGPIAIPPGDKRFSDPAYQENPVYFALAQQYLLFSQFVAELLDTAGVSGTREAKARFAARFLVDALAPTKYPCRKPRGDPQSV